MQRTIPILHVDSYEKATAYYVDWLGFTIDWEFRLEPGFPVYMQFPVKAFCYICRSTKVTTRVV